MIGVALPFPIGVPAGGAAAGAAGMLRLVESIEVTGAAVQSVTFSGLDGDTDEVYLLDGAWKCAGAPSHLQLRPNGGTANVQGSVCQFQPGASGPPADLGAGVLGIARPAGAGTVRRFWCRIEASRYGATTYRRTWSQHADDNGTQGWAQFYWGVWKDTATALSSIDVYATVAGGIDVGSKFYLYTLARS